MRDQNMAGVDIAIAPTMVWVGQSVLLKDFKHSYTTPNIVKVVQGEYMNIGANRSGGEEKESEVLLHSIQNTSKILALNMRLTDARRVEQTSQKLSIPMTYEGWFEVLSEDGRVIRAIESIKDLARIFPHTCLVRENIKAYLSKENGEICMDQCRVVQAGERLTLFGIISATVTTQQGRQEVRFLRCLDLKGMSAYFTFDQKGLFSPVAGMGNISGVHTIKGILNKFHLPLTIRLVFGTYPKQLPKGRFCGVIRLLYVYQDETAFVCPARGEYRMLPISTEVPLKVMPALNFDELKGNKAIRSVWERCSKMASSYLNSIHVLYDVNVPEPTNKNMSNPFVALNEGTEKLWEQTNAKELPKEEEEQLMDEVEDIYLYVVRHGVAPPMQTRNSSTDPGDKDYWEEPVYNTLHRKKQKDRDSLVDIVKRIESNPNPGRNKVFRFHHQPGQDQRAAGRRLSFVRTCQADVDKVVAIEGRDDEDCGNDAPPVPPKLFEKSQSLENLAAESVDEEARKKIAMMRARRKSQPAPLISKIFNKKDKKAIYVMGKDNDGSGSGGSGKGSNSTDDEAKIRREKLERKLQQMYL
ncbi:uncharacterized protein LOC135486428 [Lineus longissimus]|uniref:uncharacterized protein LOC135486428 n=1 Tax=Lineus longissimus TaxID=88925 RepID=UPI00315D7F18